MEASLRKGIFSAVDVLGRKTEGRASQARSREKQFLEAEPSVAESRCWRQKHSADRAGESSGRLWEPGDQGLRLLGQGVCSQPSAQEDPPGAAKAGANRCGCWSETCRRQAGGRSE